MLQACPNQSRYKFQSWEGDFFIGASLLLLQTIRTKVSVLWVDRM